MIESRIEKLTRIGQEMAAAVAEMNAEAVDLTPDLTTELANRQIEGEAAWWRSVDFDRNASRTFESMTGDSQQAVRTGVERVLAHLQSTGRLIPAGGMALTAEQVKDVRIVLGLNGSQDIKVVLDAQARLRALFPATEPAEDGWGDVNPNDPLGRTYRETAEEYYSAPAEPAEEETKAETCAGIFQGDRAYLCALAAGHYGDHTTANGEHWQKSSSSPAVPAPTETGPWKRIEDVPENVMVRGTDGTWRGDPDGWLRSPGARASANLCAPFVAAEEG
ncbi:hypothetical protein [Rhodococcus sp. RCBS9]|uniref:hypothetical protein n=1 Tax=Rhodococcus sp. RCBS9 TaxID=3031999 RepID=UPI0024028334|nr:hypothetical protein [Rhodococcus sp. RCBS9]WEX03839.1 hypothetical protein P0M12_30250 [Rhodococcus sp. RCBS9]WEX03918.1 hypothetical protein P0M12_00265 [Rhodococcus sp. RCBS9]